MKIRRVLSHTSLLLVLLANSGCLHANIARQGNDDAAPGHPTLLTSTKSKINSTPDSKGTNVVPPLSDKAVEERIKTLAHYATGLSLDLNEKPDEALEEYYKVVSVDPSNEPLALEISRRLIRDQKPERAIAILEKTAKNAKASGTVFAWLGVAYAQTGKNKEAIQANKTAIKRMPDNVAAYQNLGQLYIQAGQTNQAISLLKSASAQKEVDAEFLLGISDTYLRYNRQHLITDQELMPILVPLLDRAAAQNPTNPLSIQKLAETYLAVGELKKAEPFFSQLLARFPELPGLRERLASLYVRTGNKEKAGELFESMRKNRPTDPQPYILLGSLAYENKDFQKAAENYQTALKLNPDFEPLYYDLAGTYLILSKPNEGLRVLEEAKQRFRLNFTLEFYSGVIKAGLKKYQEALGHFTSAELIAKNSDPSKLNPQFYYQLGSTYERVGNIKDAEKAFRRALELQPNFAEVMNHMAYMWAEKGQNLDEAYSLMEKALKVEPDNAAFLDSMAWVLFQQKRYSDALKWMEKAMEKTDEPDPTLFEHLGDIYHALEQVDKARDAYEKSLKIEPNESISKKLQDLKSR